MELEKRVEALLGLGNEMSKVVLSEDTAYAEMCKEAHLRNNWFTKKSIDQAMLAWSAALHEENLRKWISNYNLSQSFTQSKVGVINAGNIPLVGLHDMLSVLLCGHSYIAKNASDDKLLLPFIARLLIRKEPALDSHISFVEKLQDFDAVIATGSNQSARYFSSYFGKYPHIIRKNRNGIAVLDGNETHEDMVNLGKDIFQYFGLGCRNVSKMYIPINYDLKNFFEPIFSFNDVMMHHKYMNNFDYNNAMLLMKLIPFLQNGFLILREDIAIASPISVIHYERYEDKEKLAAVLDSSEEAIQCIVTNTSLRLQSSLRSRMVTFGKTQQPALWDYADGVDTLQFLSSL